MTMRLLDSGIVECDNPGEMAELLRLRWQQGTARIDEPQGNRRRSRREDADDNLKADAGNRDQSDVENQNTVIPHRPTAADKVLDARIAKEHPEMADRHREQRIEEADQRNQDGSRDLRTLPGGNNPEGNRYGGTKVEGASNMGPTGENLELPGPGGNTEKVKQQRKKAAKDGDGRSKSWDRAHSVAEKLKRNDVANVRSEIAKGKHKHLYSE